MRPREVFLGGKSYIFFHIFGQVFTYFPHIFPTYLGTKNYIFSLRPSREQAVGMSACGGAGEAGDVGAKENDLRYHVGSR